MTFDLSLALKFSGLSLAAGSNHIYLGHVTAVITQNLIYNKLYNKMREVKAAKFLFIYIKNWVLKYKWTLKKRKK